MDAVSGETETRQDPPGPDRDPPIVDGGERFLSVAEWRAFERKFEAFLKANAGEHAKHRRARSGSDSAPRDPADPGDARGQSSGAEVSPPSTEASLKALREIGRLEARIPADALKAIDEELGDDPSAQEILRAYRIAAKVLPAAKPGSDPESGERKPGAGGPHRPRAQVGSAEPAASRRDGEAIPASWSAWQALPIERQRKVLEDHPDFDPFESLAPKRRK